jgi:uncharacterized protein
VASHVIEHCKNVTKIALRMANLLIFRGYDVDIRLVEAGALLHDIGRSRSHDVDHVVRGVEIAREFGFSEKLVRIIERHVGAGIPEDEAKELGFPDGHYIPESLEEKIVTYADKLISGHSEVHIEVTINQLAEKLGNDHPSIPRLRDLDAEMKRLLSA